MAKAKLRLDQQGLNKALNVVVAPQLEQAAKQVASDLSGHATGVQSGQDRNGKPVAYVAITEPRGLEVQAKTGALTRAAAARGMDIHRYPIGDR